MHLPATSAGISDDAPPRLPDVEEPPVVICEAAALPPQPDRQAGPPQDMAATPAVQNVEGAPPASPVTSSAPRATFEVVTAPVQAYVFVATPPLAAKPLPEITLPDIAPAPQLLQAKAPTPPYKESGDRTWVPAGGRVTVAGFTLPGLVYVGHVLAPMEGFGRTDNCLIDPNLKVSKSNADVIGQHMDYWPAYENMRPSSRRAFLEWLSGDRADPDAYIGYVFLYLYGLERRGVLERAVEDHAAIRAEVERLLAVYGYHGSFRRYAGDLLAALDILDLAPGQDPAPVFVPSGGELPPAVRVAVGSRIRDGRPIDADWLLAWTMSHPETRVRTPARRVFAHLRPEFAAEFGRVNPTGGLLLKRRKSGSSPVTYRAASGTFTADLVSAEQGTLPDLERYPEALAAGRELLELCTGRLDAYSRYLGRGAAPGQATLQALALLPPSRRQEASREAAGDSLAWLNARTAACAPVPFQEVNEQVGARGEDRPTPAKLRDLADTLGRFGIGLIPDPRFPARLPSSSTVLLFRLDGPREAVDLPSDAYKAAFLSLAVGMLVAKADGEVTDGERAILHQLATAPSGLTPDERHRLAADASWLEAHPAELPTLRSRLAELGHEQRQAVGDSLIRVASSDGTHHRAEVALIERAFRQMGLDQDRLYAALHRAGPAPGVLSAGEATPDGLVLVSLAPETERTYAIPGVPPAATPHRLPTPEARRETALPAADEAMQGAVREAATGAGEGVDAARLAAIRAETLAVSAVLADVFDADSDGASGPPADAPSTEQAAEADGAFAGLDARHAGLLGELVSRPAWPRAEFDRLAREFGLMPGAAMEDLNAWAFDRFDDILVEEGDPVHVNLHLLPDTLPEAA